MEAESGASVSGGGSDEIEVWRKEWREAFEEFQQWNMPRSPPQGNRVILQFKKDTAKRKDPPQGNTVMDAKEGLELKNNTLRQKLVFTSQHACVHFRQEFRKRLSSKLTPGWYPADLLYPFTTTQWRPA